MGFKDNPLLLFCIGLVIGIVVAETVYYIYAPTVLPDKSIEVVTDRDYYGKVSQLLSGAKQSIHMVMFSANYEPKYSDSSITKLLQDLVAAKNRGVDVQVLMDPWPEGNNKTLAYLKRNNIPARGVETGATVHAKLIIIDGRIVVVGSTNWSYYSVDKNNEANVVVNSERIASEFESYFRKVGSEGLPN